MRALCSCCGPFVTLFVILVTMSCWASAGKMYPRGNHWAVGHLMGKKSIDTYAAFPHRQQDSEFLRDARTAERYEPVQQDTPKHKMIQTAHSSALIRSRWRRGGVYRYLREITNLLRLALKLQESEYTGTLS